MWLAPRSVWLTACMPCHNVSATDKSGSVIDAQSPSLWGLVGAVCRSVKHPSVSPLPALSNLLWPTCGNVETKGV